MQLNVVPCLISKCKINTRQLVTMLSELCVQNITQVLHFVFVPSPLL